MPAADKTLTSRRCPACNGTGYNPGDHDCAECNGVGKLSQKEFESLIPSAKSQTSIPSQKAIEGAERIVEFLRDDGLLPEDMETLCLQLQKDFDDYANSKR